MVFDKPLDFKNMKSDTKKTWNGGIPVIITPFIAAFWLSLSVGKNPRPLKESVVLRYMEQLKSGNFTTRAIIFHKMGYVVDGQHFLTALVRLKMESPPTFVLLGYCDSDLPHIDDHAPRPFGVKSKLAGEKMSDKEAALAVVLKSKNLKQTATNLTTEQKMGIIREYREQIDFVNKYLTFRVKPVAMQKSVVDAYDSYKTTPSKLSRLVEFLRVYSEGFITSKYDQAAINLRMAMADIQTADNKTRAEIYIVTGSAIISFMNRSTAKRICLTKQQREILLAIKNNEYEVKNVANSF